MNKNTNRYENDGTQSVSAIFWLIIILVILVGVWGVSNPTFNTPKDSDSIVQYSTTIYHHFTVYQDNIDGTLFVVEIDVDDSIDVGCDGSLYGTEEQDENGHNCVLVAADSIHDMIARFNLPYYNVKGE